VAKATALAVICPTCTRGGCDMPLTHWMRTNSTLALLAAEPRQIPMRGHMHSTPSVILYMRTQSEHKPTCLLTYKCTLSLSTCTRPFAFIHSERIHTYSKHSTCPFFTHFLLLLLSDAFHTLYPAVDLVPLTFLLHESHPDQPGTGQQATCNP